MAFSSVSDNFDTTTANGKLVLHILGSVAQWERDIISERTRDALAHKRSELEIYTRVLPLGFEAGEDGRLIENEGELAIVKRIRVLRSRGLSYQRIAEKLNGAGLKTKKGHIWRKGTVYKVLQNPIHA